MKDRDFITVKEFAHAHRVKAFAVYQWIKAGKLTVHRFGQRILIKRTDAEAFDAAHRVEATVEMQPAPEPESEPDGRTYYAESDEDGQSMMRLLGNDPLFRYEVRRDEGEP